MYILFYFFNSPVQEISQNFWYDDDGFEVMNYYYRDILIKIRKIYSKEDSHDLLVSI